MKSMKQFLSLLLAVLLTVSVLPAAAEEAPDPVYTFEGEYVSSVSDVNFHFVLDLMEDDTAAMTPGVMFFDLDDYDEIAAGTWTETDGTLTIRLASIDGMFVKEYEVPLVDGGYAFPMSLSLAGYVRPIDMSCVTEGFVPAAAAEEAAEKPAEAPAEEAPAAPEGDKPVTARFTFSNESGSMTAQIDLYEDGSALAEYVMAAMNYTLRSAKGNWTEKDSAYQITLEADANNEETVLVSEDSQIHWVFKFAGGGSVMDADVTLKLEK